MYYIYILLCKNNSFYVGYTGDIKTRLKQHQRGEVKHTSYLNPVKLVYFEKYKIKKEAMARERQLKGWTKQKKINLIKCGHPNKLSI